MMINHLLMRSCLSKKFQQTGGFLFRYNSSATTTFSASHLLTLATAKQLKGDISDAIDLANQALVKQQSGEENDPYGAADTSLFLGKLLQFDRQYQEAEVSFSEAYRIQRSMLPHRPRDEYTALSHVAQAQKKMKRFDEAEQNFVKALNGLEATVGWKDGITNHTSFELAQMYRECGRDTEAAATLNMMKDSLGKVFGEEDSRVKQINSALAEIYIAIGDRPKAILLLDEVFQCLPPGSPESRRALMRLEEMKELDELGESCGESGIIAVTKVKKK